MLAGDAELLVSRSLMLMNSMTVGMAPLLKKQDITSTTRPGWYKEFLVCSISALKLLKEVCPLQ